MTMRSKSPPPLSPEVQAPILALPGALQGPLTKSPSMAGRGFFIHVGEGAGG